jgi:Transglutaminase-like enzymes, putative cysteine proteases
MLDYNFITVILVLGLALPIIAGAFDRFSRERIEQSVWSLINNLEFLAGFLLAIYLTRRIFFDNDSGIFAAIYSSIPEAFRTYLYGKDIVIYILAVPLLLMLIRMLLRLILSPIYNLLIKPFTNGLYRLYNNRGSLWRRLLGALSQLPKAILLVFCLGLFFNFYAYYFPSPVLSRWMNDSEAYQIVYDNAVSPALNSNIAKKIPVLVSDSFGKAADMVPAGNGTDQASKTNPLVITYFNGVTLDEAIKSNSQIDETARKIVGNETNSKKKADLLYRWVSQNIAYDYKKAALINNNTDGVSSGSIIAYNTRKGICFDYSCLYISMCRAAGLKVRLITGLAYSGIAWGDHAWNQVYCSEENRWINVDTTFGSNGNYFDKRDFAADHRYAEIQGEW